MKKQEYYKVTAPHFPAAALEYCFELWEQHKFNFKITRDRQTKLGDFRYHRLKNQYSVTVNRGLNPYSFLITYLHEVAHVVTYRQFKNTCKPHGVEWQENFRKLATPVLRRDVFPEKILQEFKKYLESPAASTSGCMPLTLALRTYDKEDEQQQVLAAVRIGSRFVFKNRTFEKIGTKRTRALCKDLGNGRNYLIPEVAQVEAVA